MSKAYAGIGSRKTKNMMCAQFADFAKALALGGWTLRSGAADGADAAFEQGCDSVKGKKEIYLGWKGFNGHSSELYNTKDGAYVLAEKHHPAWGKCSWGARRLLARNCHQILGLNLDDPVKFVICWTDQGLLKGGTALALRIALENEIPIYNFGEKDYTNEIVRWVNS